MYQPNMGVQIIAMLELGTSTLHMIKIYLPVHSWSQNEKKLN